MVNRIIVVMLVLVPFAAFGQDVTTEAADPQWVGWVISALGVVGSASVVSAFVSSERWWMKLVDALAFNWLKARNDPAEQ